ncbi:MAG: SH3 domain-containing protein [Woeseiaceae bacterium]|nr:SH3 domain-containing protein [Woeseiaceae bacterium]
MKNTIGFLIFFLPLMTSADTVVTADSVESYVNIRSAPEAGAAIVGQLKKGVPRVYVGTVDGWHEVEIADGQTGFVSADWSKVIEEVAAETEAPTEQEVPGEPAAPAEPEPAADAEPVVADAAGPAPEPEPEAAAEPAPEPVAEPEPEAVAETETVEEPEPAPAAEPAPAPETSVVPVVVAGPQGPPGPPGPPGAATINGSPGFLVKFKGAATGTSSQVFDNGNHVGIGTTTPRQRLEVNGSIQINDQNSNVAGLMITQASGETGYIMHNRASTLTIGAGSLDRITIDREGNVGLGVSRPAHPLQLASGAYVSAGGVFTNSSSREYKENVNALGLRQAVAVLEALEPVQFNYRSDRNESHLGFIAEDVPELVASTDRRGLSTMDIVAVLTRVIQSQQQRIDELESRLDGID